MPKDNREQRGGQARRLLRGEAIAAMVRRDIPVAKLMPEYGVPPSKFVEIEGMRIRYRDAFLGP